MKIMKNHEFSKIFIFQKPSLRVVGGIRGARPRTGTAPGTPLRRLRLPQRMASGVEVCGLSQAGVARVDAVATNHGKRGNLEKS